MRAVNKYLWFSFKVESEVYVGAETIGNICDAKLVELIIHTGMSVLVIMFFALKYT